MQPGQPGPALRYLHRSGHPHDGWRKQLRRSSCRSAPDNGQTGNRRCRPPGKRWHPWSPSGIPEQRHPAWGTGSSVPGTWPHKLPLLRHPPAASLRWQRSRSYQPGARHFRELPDRRPAFPHDVLPWLPELLRNVHRCKPALQQPRWCRRSSAFHCTLPPAPSVQG